MRFQLRLGALLAIMAALVLLAPLAEAQSTSDWKIGPSSSDGACGGSISSGRQCWYPMTGTTATDSTVKIISAEYATVCFDPNLASTGAAAGQVRVMWSNSNEANGAAGSLNHGEPIINETLTGAAGDDCLYEVPTGRIWIDVTVAMGAGVDGVVTVVGAPK